MREYFENLVNEAIMSDAETPKEYQIWSEHEGWSVRNRETGEEIEIIIREVYE